jgi:hypothetical protein
MVEQAREWHAPGRSHVLRLQVGAFGRAGDAPRRRHYRGGEPQNIVESGQVESGFLDPAATLAATVRT